MVQSSTMWTHSATYLQLLQIVMQADGQNEFQGQENISSAACAGRCIATKIGPIGLDPSTWLMY